MNIVIEAKELCHQFGENAVLKNVNLEVRRGEIFGLLGPSGAGKTTLINILTGQLSPKGGESSLLGTDSRKLTGSDYEKMGIMMDSFGLYERMSCYDNLRFFMMLDGGDKRRIDAVLEQVGLLEARKTLAMKLSKGMRNRLCFARALLRNPEILFLDEPASGLDPATTEAIHNLILQEKEKGTTIFLTTHNMYEAEMLCDNIALLNEGRIVEYGSPADICRRYYHQKRIKIRLRNGEDVELAHTKESGRQIEGYFEKEELETIHSTEPNLETVFMELTGKAFEK